MLWTTLQQNLPRTPLLPERMTQSLGVMPPVVYPNKFISFLEKFTYCSLLEMPIILGFIFKTYSSTIFPSKFVDVQ